MKIEVGKFYKTRGGDKVRIYATDGSSSYPVHGAIESEFGWCEATWTLSGYYGGCKTGDMDIISEWSEPRPKLKAWIVDGKLEFQDSGLIFHFTGMAPKTIRAPWLDEPEEST